MTKLLSPSLIYPIYIFLGAAWIAAIYWLPEGLVRSITIVAFGFCVVGVFVWLLVARLRTILTGTNRLLLTLAAVPLDLLLLLLAFAAAFQNLGLIDNTLQSKPIIHEFGTSLYYSVSTFTTLGYGDLYPVGVGRVFAAMQALTGYVILAIVASTSVSIISSYRDLRQ